MKTRHIVHWFLHHLLKNMSNVILGKFPDKIIINDPEIASNDFGEKIVKIPTRFNKEREIESKINELQESIIKIIDRIIEEWIEDFLTETWEKIDDDIELDLRKRELLKHTRKIWDEMYIKSQWIEEAIDFVWNDEKVSIDIKPEYLLWAIEWLLNNYRNKVFKQLIKNEKRLKNNK